MPNDKPSKDHHSSSAPPPMDPFPTYQTPYTRPSKDEENPFIQFRRFADEQVSSLFSGFPSIFGVLPNTTTDSTSESNHWKKDVEDIMRQRQEWEEGFRKKFEQEMEELRQQMEKGKTEAWKSMEDAWKQHLKREEKTEDDRVAAVANSVPAPWWTKGKAAQCPALNGEPQENAQQCPALYDEQGQPRTELDAYEALPAKDSDKQVQVFKAPEIESTKQHHRSWLSSVGHDGKQRQAQPEKASKERPIGERSVPRPTMYGIWAARRMQPFDDADQTIPWLMLSPYSPIYLCNPAQSRLFKVKIQDAEGVPLQISNAKFFDRWYTGVDERLATRKPWADAFEDLLSLQLTGRMVERENWTTWRTPRTWFHDMASRGSLGDRWGFDKQGMLVKRADSTRPALVTKNDRATRRRQRESIRDIIHGWAGQRESATTEQDLGNKVVDVLLPFPLFGNIISAADAIVDSIDRAAQNETQAQPETSVSPIEADSGATGKSLTDSLLEYQSHLMQLEDEHKKRLMMARRKQNSATKDGGPKELELDTGSKLSESSSISSSSPTSESNSKKSIISTLSSTTTRTLSDGSHETKRTLRRRFADGTEECDESVEVRDPSGSTSKPSPLTAREDKNAQADHADELQALADQFHPVSNAIPIRKFKGKPLGEDLALASPPQENINDQKSLQSTNRHDELKAYEDSQASYAESQKNYREDQRRYEEVLKKWESDASPQDQKVMRTLRQRDRDDEMNRRAKVHKLVTPEVTSEADAEKMGKALQQAPAPVGLQRPTRAPEQPEQLSFEKKATDEQSEQSQARRKGSGWFWS